MPRLDVVGGARSPGPGPALRPARPRRALRGGGGHRPGRGDAPSMNSTVIHQIVTLFRGGASIRRIAQRLRVSRHTVRRALAQLEQDRTAGPPEGLPHPAPPRGSQLDAYEAAIGGLLARHPEITARRIYEELRQMGY